MLVVSSLSCVAFAASPASPPLLAALWALNGVSQSAGYPLCMKALVPHVAKGNHGTVMGWWCTCQQVGGVLSTAFAAWLLGHQGWRSAFLYPAVVVAGTAAVVMALLPPAPTNTPPGPGQGGGSRV